MGTPHFAIPSLEILLDNNFDVVAVITATDKYGGRGKNKLIESPVKVFAKKRGLKVLQPKNLKDKAFVEELKSYNADLQIVVAFRMLPEVVWNMPRLGTYNLHASLLPKYRGAAPINWAIINGEKETGVTTFKLTHNIDEGDILYQEKVLIDENENATQLHDRLMSIGADVVLKTVNSIKNNDIELSKQNDSEMTLAPKIFTENCRIDWNKSVDEVFNFIRGLSQYPGAWTIIDGKVVKIYGAEKDDAQPKNSPGTIEVKGVKTLNIACQSGQIKVRALKMQGKKLMDVSPFLNGYKIQNLRCE